MAESAVTAVGILRIVLGSLVLALFLWLVWKTLRVGPDLVMTRAMLQLERSVRIAVILIISLLLQLASTAIELYGNVTGGLSAGPDLVNEGLEAGILLLFLAALALFVPIVRIPADALRPSKAR